MSDRPADLEREAARHLQELLADGAVSLELVQPSLSLSDRLLQAQRPQAAVTLLEALVRRVPREARAWPLLARGLVSLQRLPEARAAYEQAASHLPGDVELAIARARATLDAGLPASSLFAQALRLSAGHPAALAGLAAAYVEEGDAARADAVLSDVLAVRPEWLPGHKALADLRRMRGDREHFDRAYALACAARPDLLPLRLAWFGALAQAGAWERASRVVAEGEAPGGAQPGLLAARAFAASEQGEEALADELFARVAAAASQDPGSALAHLRHCLKTARLDAAQGIVDRFLRHPAAPMFWPYQSLLWRLRGDARAAWLEGDAGFVRTYDLGLASTELDALAHLLRRLHGAELAFPDQSVRGGTQTHVGLQLFFRAEPEIQHLRAVVLGAVADYIGTLPAPDPSHPLLGVPRAPVLFSGSWSVRLRGGGHHVSHTHPNGWISSALHVALPEPGTRGPAPAGWLRFGSPPAGLGLDLPHYAQIEPRPGQLVLFPSTMWHQTVPFGEGERLSIAFDIQRPYLTA